MARGIGRNVVVPSAGGGGGLTNINVSAGTTSNNLSNLVFDNGGGVTFGLDGSTVTASAPAAGGGLTNIRVSAGTTSNLLSDITFANGSNVSWGINASTITASVATSLTNMRVSAGTTSNLLSALTFADGSNVSWGINASTVTASVATSLTNFRLSAGTTSNLLSAVTFADSNGLSFGINASTVTASHNALTAQSNQSVGIYAVSNTTQGTSGTFDARTISFNGAGIASVGITNGSVVVSVPAGGGAGDGGVFAGVSTAGNTAGSTGTVSTGNFVLVGSNGISLSQSTGAAGSEATVTINGYMPRIGLFNNLVPAGDSGNEPHKVFAMLGDGTINVIPLMNAPFAGPFPGLITAKTAYMRMSLSGSTATMSQSFTVSMFLGIYTTNQSTLSLLNSVSASFGSGAANANLSTIAAGNRYMTFDSSAWSSEPVFYPGSVYYLASFLRTSNVSWQTMSFFGAGYAWASNSGSHSGTIGVATANATTMGIAPWVGRYSVSSNAFPGTIGSAELNKQAAFAAVPMIIFNENNPASF